MKKRKKVGLALGSGGIRGLAHVGVIKTLAKHKIPIDFIAGSSIGAWVGAYYALFKDIEKLEDLTVNSKTEKLHALFEPSLRGGLIGGGKMKKLLELWLDNSSFEQTKIPLALVATDLKKRETCVFSSGPLVPAVQASMAIPGAFKPILYKDRVLVDGGISDPIPTDVVKSMGADIVIGVNLYGLIDDLENEVKTTFGFMNVSKRSMEIMRYYLAKQGMRGADIVIEPPVEKYASWANYFMQDDGAKIVSVGAEETEKIIPALKKLLA